MQALLEKVYLLDVTVFHWINGRLYMDWLAQITYHFARDQMILLFAGAGACLYGLWKGWRRLVAPMLLSAAAVILTNLVQNQMFKPFFNRTRPFLALDQVHLSAPLRDLSMVSLSFPSTHAASSAALAVVVSRLDPSLRWPMLALALMIGFFTVYSGGHFPLDVLAGYVVGALVGWGITALAKQGGVHVPVAPAIREQGLTSSSDSEEFADEK